MSSASNTPNPWGPYDSYKDCSQGICSIYCPQWCYIIFPPPPPLSLEDESGTDFSPLIIAVIGILASAFILVSYYAIISKYCRRRGRGDSGLEFSENRDQMSSNEASQLGSNNIGLDEALIKSITVFKYKKGDGLIEGTDCSVCLSEFQEDESLRLLPKCSHAFHLPCIDTWLKSHCSCPLCRANIAISTNTSPSQAAAPTAVQETPPADLIVSVHQYQHRSESVSVIHDLENGEVASQEAVVSIVVSEDASKTPIDQGLRDPETVGERHNIIQVGIDQPNIVRSASLNSSVCQGQGHVLVADILRENIEDGYQMESTEKSRSSRVMNMVRSPLALKRSVSTGRFVMSTMYGKVGNSFNIPNNNWNV